MPRPPRRTAQAAPNRDAATMTPTRPSGTNIITANIPPSMLETPPHAPFLTTPLPNAAGPSPSAANAPRPTRNGRPQHSSPAGLSNGPTPNGDQSQVSSNALGSIDSDIVQGDEQSLLDHVHQNVDEARQLAGLRDISSLATWTLSSAKPGCALAQLRHPSPAQFWQSDGPQPHTLTLHFFKLVSIVKLRVYLDFELDESYTPTKMKFFAGMSEGGLVEFGAWEVEETVDPDTGETHSSIENVRGWIDISLKGVGGRDASFYEEQEARRLQAQLDGVELSTEDEDPTGGDVLRAMVVQVRVCENHQNGKDTHVRGFQVFAKDDTSTKDMRKVVKRNRNRHSTRADRGVEDDSQVREVISLQPADWMGDPEIR